jgi:hypothetical protein
MKKWVNYFVCLFALGSSFQILNAADAGRDVLAAYEPVRAALAGDDLKQAKASALELSKKAGAAKMDVIAKASDELAKSDSIEKAREQFKTISNEAVKIAKDKKGYFILTCSMAKGDWVQTSTKVENPYYGKQMLACGEVKTK